MTHDRRTKALRPGMRRFGAEVLAATRDWLCNESGARGVPLGRVVDALVEEKTNADEQKGATMRTFHGTKEEAERGLVGDVRGAVFDVLGLYGLEAHLSEFEPGLSDAAEALAARYWGYERRATSLTKKECTGCVVDVEIQRDRLREQIARQQYVYDMGDKS